MSKQPIDATLGDKFNLKMLMYGAPGSGKTTFAGSYTHGPVHFYATDPQGVSVLRNTKAEITVDNFTDELYGQTKTYPAFYKQLQKDEKDGFFQSMFEREGIIVIDSYTTLENYLVDYVAESVLKKKKQEGGAYEIRRQDWPTVSSYVLGFFKTISSLPCATLIICHTKSIQDAENNIYFRPTILGQQAEQAPRWFSDYFQASLEGNQFILRVRGNPRVPASSRLFLPESNIDRLKGPTMDTIYKAFHGQKLDCKTV